MGPLTVEAILTTSLLPVAVVTIRAVVTLESALVSAMEATVISMAAETAKPGITKDRFHTNSYNSTQAQGEGNAPAVLALSAELLCAKLATRRTIVRVAGLAIPTKQTL